MQYDIECNLSNTHRFMYVYMYIYITKVTWKCRVAPVKTTIIYCIGPLMSFHVNLEEGASCEEPTVVPQLEATIT